MASPTASDPPTITIVGAGIIGASIAYHLSLHSRRAVLLEQHSPACAASGRAGGFLALDWCDTSALRLLARPSFRMHADLSATLPSTGYRALSAYSASLVSRHAPPSRRLQRAAPAPPLAWLDGDAPPVAAPRRIGTERTVAQVHPRKLTLALLERARENVGTSVDIARVDHVVKRGAKWVLTTRTRGGVVGQRETDVLVLAMGPWTTKAQQWFPRMPAVVAQKAASLVVQARVPGTAVFTEFVNGRGEPREPEVYPREEEVYLCQSAVAEELPDDPGNVGVDERDVEDLKEFARGLSKTIGEAVDMGKVAGQACNLPVSPDGLSLIGTVPGAGGSAFVAAGHSVWGILNSPATGKAVAEMIVLGKSSIDVSPFSPDRFG